ncbi:MAG TPA: peptide-N-glycosidase F-related protein [Candidatus Kapabacteria bacterium]|nr:peptide-N-glycosidase F-related protein [Candidatus Kapabacteria bacterium]
MYRKIYLLILTCVLVVPSSILISAPGDTTKVRTIDFQQRRLGWFNFPSLKPNNVERILMNYKLRCPPGKPCGEWDYLAYVYVSQFYAVNFRVNNSFPTNYSCMYDTSWAYKYENGEVVKSAKASSKLYLYQNQDTPAVPTDSIVVWPTYYTYNFDDKGVIMDSTAVEPDTTITRYTIARVDFDNENTMKEDIEIFRYITPYGNGLSLGDGVTWVIDVSDFALLLRGSVYIHAPCGGWGDQYDQNTMEDLELTFDIIEGTPPRNPINFVKLWDLNGVTYDSNIESKLQPIKYNFTDYERSAVLRVTQTGHGFGSTQDNCSEFCSKKSYVTINGVNRFTTNIWRECGDNPIYPQGGTWIYDRSNWCPGAEVGFFDYDLSPFITPNLPYTIDYDMEPYNLVVTGSGTPPNWVIRGFLFTYDEANFNNDARLTRILSPSIDPMNNRLNPMIGVPTIEIQNTGKNTIYEVTFKYGNDLNNLVEYTATLDEAIDIMGKAKIDLPFNNWYNADASDIFYLEITKVNNEADEYIYNNKGQQKFTKSLPEVPNKFSIEFTGNNSDVLGISSPYVYSITDKNGNIVFDKQQTVNNKVVLDEVELKEGQYTLLVQNPYGYGFGFWAYAQNGGLKNASLKLLSASNLIKVLPTDWGNFYQWGFEVTPQVQLLSNIENDEIDFGSVSIGKKVVKEIKIFPANSQGLTISDIKLPLSSTKKFEIIEESSTATPNPRVLTVNDTLTLKLEFEPLSKGKKTANLYISSNDKYNSNMNFAIKGEALEPNSVDDTDGVGQIGIKLQNRANQVLGVELSNILANKILNYTITNLDGAVIAESKVSQNVFEINIQNLSSGVYFITINYQTGTINKKFNITK